MLKSDWTRDNCAVGNTLAVIGERWTLLVLREAFLGVRRFDQLQRNTGMARNILSDRLNTLVAHEVLERELYQERPQRYEYRLTERVSTSTPCSSRSWTGARSTSAARR